VSVHAAVVAGWPPDLTQSGRDAQDTAAWHRLSKSAIRSLCRTFEERPGKLGCAKGRDVIVEFEFNDTLGQFSLNTQACARGNWRELNYLAPGPELFLKSAHRVREPAPDHEPGSLRAPRQLG
jgi:hypothetical protein